MQIGVGGGVEPPCSVTVSGVESVRPVVMTGSVFDAEIAQTLTVRSARTARWGVADNNGDRIKGTTKTPRPPSGPLKLQTGIACSRRTLSEFKENRLVLLVSWWFNS